MLSEDATNERIVFVYRGLRPVQVPPTNTDKDKDKSAANATPGIGSKRPRKEEQDGEYGVVYDIFRERRVGGRKGQAIGSTSSTGAPATSTTATTTTTVSEGTTRGVRFAEGSKITDREASPSDAAVSGQGLEARVQVKVHVETMAKSYGDARSSCIMSANPTLNSTRMVSVCGSRLPPLLQRRLPRPRVPLPLPLPLLAQLQVQLPPPLSLPLLLLARRRNHA